MKNLHTLLFAFFLLVILFVSYPAVSAVECGATPTDGCTVSQNTVFAQATYNLPNGISIVAPSLLLNCNGATLRGSFTAGKNAITLQPAASKNLIIRNCIITNYSENGIETKTNVSNSAILNNQFIGNRRGLYFVDNSPSSLTSSSYNTISGNHFYENTDAGIIIAAGTFSPGVPEGNIISTNVINHSAAGIMIDKGNHTVITLNIIQYTGKGISISGGGAGYAVANNITYNVILNNGQGILLDGEVSDSLIASNGLEFNTIGGLILKVASNNEVTENFISGTSGEGIIVGFAPGQPTSNNNTFHRNNFLNNVQSGRDYGNNSWNTTWDGNYWLEYSQASNGCLDLNFNNICDNPYDVNAGGGASGLAPSSQGIDFMPQTGMFGDDPPPSFSSPVPDVDIEEGETATLVIDASGGTGQLMYRTTHPLFVNNSNVLSWQTNFTDAQTYDTHVETVIIQDSNNMKAIQNITVTVENAANTECSNGLKNSCTVSNTTILNSRIADRIIPLRDGIRVMGNNLVFDCAHAIIDGSGFPYVNDGIKINGAGVTLKNCNVQNYDEGIKVTSSSNTILDNVQAMFNRVGITLSQSGNSKILSSTSNENRDYGISLTSSQNSVLDGVTTRSNINPNTNFNSAGIKISGSNNVTVTNSLTTLNSFRGIEMLSSNGLLSNNVISYNGENGIHLAGISNMIRENTLQANTVRGILFITGANGNTIIQNNFLNNPQQAVDLGSSNVFDLNNKGNYWTDFDTSGEGCDDSDANGFCDAARPIPVNNQDDFPFTNPHGWINHWPIIISVPPTTITSFPYTYDVDAVDPDNHPVTYSLLIAPSGMTIDAFSGLITWNHALTQDSATGIPVTVKAEDSLGGMRTQAWDIFS